LNNRVRYQLHLFKIIGRAESKRLKAKSRKPKEPPAASKRRNWLQEQALSFKLIGFQLKRGLVAQVVRALH
jgi:hypothetical protein